EISPSISDCLAGSPSACRARTCSVSAAICCSSACTTCPTLRVARSTSHVTRAEATAFATAAARSGEPARPVTVSSAEVPSSREDTRYSERIAEGGASCSPSTACAEWATASLRLATSYALASMAGATNGDTPNDLKSAVEDETSTVASASYTGSCRCDQM